MIIKEKRSDIEVVITSYTGTVVVLNKGPWVRIPLTPPSKKREANCLSKNMK